MISSALRPIVLLLLLLLATLSGCGQKGDLFRPGKQGTTAAGAGFSAHA